MARQIKFENIISSMEKFALQKDAFIVKLGKQLEKKDLEIKDLKKKLRDDPKRKSLVNTFRYQKEAGSVYSRWKRIKDIVKKRKSAYSIDEYLFLKAVIDFDDE